MLTHHDIAKDLQIGISKARRLIEQEMVYVVVADYGNGKEKRVVDETDYQVWKAKRKQRKVAPTQMPRKQTVYNGKPIPKTLDEIFS